MAIFIAAIATAQRLGTVPNPLLHKPFSLDTDFLGVTTIMNEDATGQDEPQAEAHTGPYDFLYELGKLDHTTGVMTQTELGAQLDRVEGVIRGAAKAISKAVPVERLKEEGKGKLTELGVALVTACVNREDATLEAWVHGLMEAMKSPEFRQVSGEKSTADDIDLGFLDRKIKDEQTQSTDLALTSQGELEALIRKNKELQSKFTEVSEQEKDRVYQAAYNRRIALMTEQLKADIAAQQAFEKALREGGLTPEI